jgi:hypothetical protein
MRPNIRIVKMKLSEADAVDEVRETIADTRKEREQKERDKALREVYEQAHEEWIEQINEPGFMSGPHTTPPLSPSQTFSPGFITRITRGQCLARY